jgi:hypothetical protein
MTTSVESKLERTDLSTRDLPKIPTIQEMVDWDQPTVLRWLNQRHQQILIGDDLDNFSKKNIIGRAFLNITAESFENRCGLTYEASVSLKSLADEVKLGTSFPWT